MVLPLGDVPVESDRQLDEARRDPLRLIPGFGLELVTGLAQVAHGELEQPGRLAAERLRLVAIGEFLHRPVEVIAENQIHRPLLQPFLGPTARLPHLPDRGGRTP